MNISYPSNSSFTQQQVGMLVMNVSSLAHCCLDNTWKSANAKAPFTRIYIPIKGRGHLVCGSVPADLLPGNIYVIPANAELSFSCDDYLEKVFAHIIIPRADLQDLFYGQNRCAIIPDTGDVARKFVEKCASDHLSDALLLKGLLYEIVAEAMDQLGMNAVAGLQYSPVITSAIEYINNHLSAKLTAQKVAEEIFVSVHSLQKRFKQEVGITMGKYINSRLTTTAAYALYSSNLSVKQISQELGFCDQFYFSRVFSAHYGMTPSQYRRRVRR